MNDERHPKVKARHLARDAYLYVRQATLHTGSENTQAIQRQYHLWQQAVALGWPAERVIVIDNDLGQSGASTADGRVFQELVRQVRLGRIGIVMALEPSRLTRNGTDWRRLLGACAMNDTLVLVCERLYDPADANDRVLLECGETMPRPVEFSRKGKESLV
jgi:DNA invertase Pin-like site-specific DNA recombinase